jgi:competence protein ComEC
LSRPAAVGILTAAARVPALVLGLAWCVGIGVATVLLPSQPLAAAAGLALAVPLLAVAMVTRPAIVALAVAAALLGTVRAELPVTDPHVAQRAAAVAGQVATVEGHVVDDPRAAAGGAEVLVAPSLVAVGGTAVDGIGNIMVRWRGPAAAGFGDAITATGKLILPRDLPTFDRRAYLAQRQSYLELEASVFDVVGSASGILPLAAAVRRWYTAALDSALPPPHAGVLLGIVLGVHQGIPPDLQAALVTTGLVHLLVLSGLKVAVFARIVQGALRPLLGRLAAWPAVGLISMYALVGGATPAAVRAAAMGGLAIAATALGRPTHVWTSLALAAAAMLGWRPELAWDVGFQLSFAGTAAIIWLTPAIERRLRRIPGFLREPFAVTCAAQVGTLPMMASDFHLISPSGPIANALVLPLLPAAVVAGLALGPLSLLPEFARVAAIPVAGLLEYIEQVGYALAKVPIAAVAIPRFPAWAGLAYYSSIAPAVASRGLHGRARRVAVIAAFGAPLLIACAAMFMWAVQPERASVLAVGDGQAVLFQGPHGAFLVDSGPSPSRLADQLGQLVPPWQRELDAIAITAPTQGHVGGFVGFNGRVAVVLLPDVAFPGTTWRTTALDAAARGARIARLLAGAIVDVAGFRIEVLAPEVGSPGEVVGAADLAVRVVAPSGRSFCDLSDLDVDAQAIAASRLRGPCTYLLMPSRGQAALAPELQQAAGDAQLIVSLASGRLAAGLPATVSRTDQEGTITVAM